VNQNKTLDNFGKYGPIAKFNNPFTVAFCNELQKKLLHNLPPHLKSVAALPCEI